MNSHYCYYWVIIIYPTFSILSKTCSFPVIFLFSLIMEGLWHFRVNAALNASIEYLNFKLGCNTPQFQCFLCSHQRNRHWRLIYVTDSFNLLIFILFWYLFFYFFSDPPEKPKNLSCQTNLTSPNTMTCSWDPGQRNPLLRTSYSLHTFKRYNIFISSTHSIVKCWNISWTVHSIALSVMFIVPFAKHSFKVALCFLHHIFFIFQGWEKEPQLWGAIWTKSLYHPTSWVLLILWNGNICESSESTGWSNLAVYYFGTC